MRSHNCSFIESNNALDNDCSLVSNTFNPTKQQMETSLNGNGFRNSKPLYTNPVLGNHECPNNNKVLDTTLLWLFQKKKSKKPFKIKDPKRNSLE